MVETDHTGGAAYLTCNERHHELILIESRRAATTNRARGPRPAALEPRRRGPR